MWTKRELIAQAFEDAGLASYAVDLAPEQWHSALRKMDSMLATWAAKGVQLGYAMATGADTSDLNQPSGLQTTAHEAVYLNLALRIAPAFGKAIAPGTAMAAKDAHDSLLIRAALPQPVQMPRGMPLGAGFKRQHDQRGPFVNPPDTSTVQTSPAGNLDFLEP